MNKAKWGNVAVAYPMAEKIKQFATRTGLTQGQVIDLACADVVDLPADEYDLTPGSVAREMFRRARPEIKP